MILLLIPDSLGSNRRIPTVGFDPEGQLLLLTPL